MYHSFVPKHNLLLGKKKKNRHQHCRNNTAHSPTGARGTARDVAVEARQTLGCDSGFMWE